MTKPTPAFRKASRYLAFLLICFLGILIYQQGNVKVIPSYLEAPLEFTRLSQPFESVYIDSTSDIKYGRFSKACLLPDITRHASVIQVSLQQKEWSYFSVSTPDYFLAFVFLDVQYISGGFVYIFEKESGNKWESASLRPGVIGPAIGLGNTIIAEGSINGKSAHDTDWGLYTAEYVDNAWLLNFSVNLKKDNGTEMKEVKGSVKVIHMDTDDMVLVFPVRTSADEAPRPAYIHKGMSYPVEGNVFIDNVAMDLTDALGGIDWTRAFPLRVTKWLWSSFNGYTSADGDKRRIGVNLSRFIYDTNDGQSQENAIWVDGTVYVIPGEVKFTIPPPESVLSQPWTMELAPSKDKIHFKFTFQPAASREEHLYLPLLVADFVQAVGSYSGTFYIPEVGSIYFTDILGVAEQHLAKW